MPTPTEVIEQIIDPVAEDVAEIEALEGNEVHISGTETITGLKTLTQTVTAPLFVGTMSGHLASGIIVDGPINMNGFGFTNVSGTGFELLTNKGAANGYAPLGAGSLVPMANLGTGGNASGTNFLADDGTFKPISAGSVSFGTQSANRIFAGPTTGSAAAPGFRVLVAADIPTLAQSKITNLETDLASKVPNTRTITEGDGLKGETHDLSANVTINMGSPSSLAVDSANGASGTTHTHAIASSSNPGASDSILASDGTGYLTLVRLTLTDRLLINASTANLFLKDTSTGFKATTTGIITPQAGNIWRNTTYTSGLIGWNIDDDGNAEFNNLLVRGSIKAAVFTINEIAATAGTLGVFYSAATVQDDFTTPASTSSSFSFNAKNSDAGGMLFGVADIIRFKTWTGSGISDSWATVTARTNHTTYATYTATLNNGSTSATFRAGSAAVDYGPSGTGFITMSADGTVGSSPNLTMATHAGSPWSGQTLLMRAGNLNGSYDYATNVYGVGIGKYAASASWLTFDTTNGIRIGNNTTTVGQWDTSGNILVGQTGAGKSNVYITAAGAIQIRQNTTAVSVWDSTGMLIGQNGAGQSNVAIDNTDGLRLRLATTNLFQVDTSGNVILGQLATDKANVYWNASNSRLQFRGSTSGTVVQSYINTDGSFVSGAGAVKLSSTGLVLESDSSITGAPAVTTRSIQWASGADTVAYLYNGYTGAGGSSLLAQISLIPATDTLGIAEIYIAAKNDAGARAVFRIINQGSANAINPYMMMYREGSSAFKGLTIGDAVVPTHMLDVYGTGWFQDGVNAGGTVTVGGITDPGTGRLALSNTTTPGALVGGGALFVASGALKYKGSSGTVTTLAPA